jgi:hypothetical protein
MLSEVIYILWCNKEKLRNESSWFWNEKYERHNIPQGAGTYSLLSKTEKVRVKIAM